MRYIIFSDVHSNLEALQTFFRLTEDIPHDKKVCLGDMVGYGADPNPVLELIKEKTDLILAGNHDYGVIGKTDVSYFNPYAYSACMWTRNELSEENWQFLKSLGTKRMKHGITWVHSSPFEPEEWHYVVSASDGPENFDHFHTSVCFVGHSHKPLILEQQPQGQVLALEASPYVCLDPGCRYIVNAGSLGQPRDGNPQPCFVVYDDVESALEFIRFDYDLETTQQKILENGLPPFLAQRIAVGH